MPAPADPAATHSRCPLPRAGNAGHVLPASRRLQGTSTWKGPLSQACRGSERAPAAGTLCGDGRMERGSQGPRRERPGDCRSEGLGRTEDAANQRRKTGPHGEHPGGRTLGQGAPSHRKSPSQSPRGKGEPRTSSVRASRPAGQPRVSLLCLHTFCSSLSPWVRAGFHLASRGILSAHHAHPLGLL